MSAEYLFMTDKLYDVQYDTGDKVIQCGRHNDIFKLWLQWRAKVVKIVFKNIFLNSYCKWKLSRWRLSGNRWLRETHGPTHGVDRVHGQTNQANVWQILLDTRTRVSECLLLVSADPRKEYATQCWKGKDPRRGENERIVQIYFVCLSTDLTKYFCLLFLV